MDEYDPNSERSVPLRRTVERPEQFTARGCRQKFPLSKLSEGEIEAPKNQLANPDLWVISRCFGHVTFMFYTDAQVAKYEANGLKEVYARKYLAILKPNDEFGYLSADDFAVSFDSKQNFDDNYNSNWYWYYK